jgi:hypothetical protein
LAVLDELRSAASEFAFKSGWPGYSRVRPHSAEGPWLKVAEEFVFFLRLVFFFVPPSRPAWSP